jgi:hypothetical protein
MQNEWVPTVGSDCTNGAAELRAGGTTVVFDSRQGYKRCLFSEASRPTLGLTQLSIQLIPETIPRSVKLKL